MVSETSMNLVKLIVFIINRSPQFSHMVVLKFDRYNRRCINFDDFIQACVMLKSLTDSFRAKDATQQGVINIQYEEVMGFCHDFYATYLWLCEEIAIKDSVCAHFGCNIQSE